MAEITPVSYTRKRSMSSSIQKPNWNRCLCHVKENVQGQLTAFTSKSWEKFESCSTRRRDEIWLIMKDYWNEGPKGGYYRQCYQEYTDINKVSKEEQSHCNTREDRDGESLGLSIGIEPSCKQLAKLEEQNCQEEDAGTEGYDRAFGKVKEFVEKEVIAAAKAIPMSTLIEKYTSFLTEEGVDVVTYRSTKLKNRLTRFFGERLSFHRPSNQNQSELVYGSHVKTGEVVETVFKSTTSVEEEQMANSDSEPDLTNARDEVSRQVYHTAKTIQKLVANMKPTMPWPPSSEDLECEIEMVPYLLYNMMAWILSTKSEYSVERVSDISPEVHRLALSLSRDLIHSATRGRIKTPKHVVLPMTVKSLTGNVELITILNRFGHGLSYSQIEEVETALAEMQIAKRQNGVFVPSVCYPDVPGVFCWDNNDLQEETLSGKL